MLSVVKQCLAYSCLNLHVTLFPHLRSTLLYSHLLFSLFSP
uniref:Uncharacterized protein n=1 Tax=Arundo donax TaxID=35708 RepID=A0A0A9GY73_ARUDO